jgi:hypothetical protein
MRNSPSSKGGTTALQPTALGEKYWRTRCWRLKIQPEDIEFVPDRDVVVGWLETRLPKLEQVDAWVEELEALVSAQIALQRGQAEVARDLTRTHAFGTHPEFEAWLGLLDARATDIYISPQENDLALDVLLDQWSERTDVLGRSIAARIAARVALRRRFSEPDVQLSWLSKIAADLEHSGDIGALAVVLNVQGILLTRSGLPERACYYHCRAAALFGIVGDYNSLQGTLFNLANCRVKALAKTGENPDARSFDLLELSKKVCQTFNVGQDSVQTEISGCHWCVDAGDYEGARVFLESGKVVVDALDSEFDQACYLLARGRLTLIDPGRGDPTHDLQASRRLFVKVGDHATLAWIDELLSKCKSSKS